MSSCNWHYNFVCLSPQGTKSMRPLVILTEHPVEYSDVKVSSVGLFDAENNAAKAKDYLGELISIITCVVTIHEWDK